MSRPPNDSEQRRPARKSKRVIQADTSVRANPPTSRTNVVAFPVTDASRAKPDAAPGLPEIQQAIDTPLSLTPLQLLATILKVILRDRIKDEEVHRICKAYYDSLSSIWGDEAK